MRCILYLILLLLPFHALRAQQPQKSIESLLQRQTDAWNKGDLEGFMQTYWRSDSLMFVGKNGPSYGWQTTLDHYRKSYPDTAAMGKLHFDLLETRYLARDVYFVVGKWHLQRSVGNLDGSFTLVIRRIKGEWKIIADHSS